MKGRREGEREREGGKEGGREGGKEEDEEQLEVNRNKDNGTDKLEKLQKSLLRMTNKESLIKSP